MSPRDLKAYNLFEGQPVTLEFEGDITVSGTNITGIRNIHGKIILISFKDCTVKHGDTVLFQPEWGIYDMAVGAEVVSAFSGPADYRSFNLVNHVPSSKTIKAKRDEDKIKLEGLYQAVRSMREDNKVVDLNHILDTLTTTYSSDWLLTVEILELAKKQQDTALYQKALNRLEQIKVERPKVAHLIIDGVNIIEQA